MSTQIGIALTLIAVALIVYATIVYINDFQGDITMGTDMYFGGLWAIAGKLLAVALIGL